MKAINILTIRMIFVYLLLIPVALMKAGVVETSGSRDLLDTLSPVSYTHLTLPTIYSV